LHAGGRTCGRSSRRPNALDQAARNDPRLRGADFVRELTCVAATYGWRECVFRQTKAAAVLDGRRRNYAVGGAYGAT
jgi:hypothetical protein